MEKMVDALKAKSSSYWEITQHNPNAWTVGKGGGDWAICLRARSETAQICIPAGLVDTEFQNEPDGPQFSNGQRLRMVQVDRARALGLVYSERGYWYVTLNAEEYETSKIHVLKLMLLAQARLLMRMGV